MRNISFKSGREEASDDSRERKQCVLLVDPASESQKEAFWAFMVRVSYP